MTKYCKVCGIRIRDNSSQLLCEEHLAEYRREVNRRSRAKYKKPRKRFDPVPVLKFDPFKLVNDERFGMNLKSFSALDRMWNDDVKFMDMVGRMK